ncbi:cation:proton antiporter [Weissella confusa]|nr:cation:proton antiporter [Weissella confusa]
MEIVMMLGLLVVTLGFGWIAGKLGFAKVVGQLIAGVVVGPALLGLVAPSHLMHVVSEFGVMLLMVNAGLETDARQLLQNFKASNFVALMGVVAPLAVFPVVALLFGYEWQIALFWGVVFAATSISITISVLG